MELNGKRILIYKRLKNCVNDWSKILQTKKAKTISYSDIENAWRSIKYGPEYDLVIIEFCECNFAGSLLLGLIRHGGLERISGSPVIAVCSTSKYRNKALKMGANAYITKPLYKNRLVETIEDLETIPE